MIFKITETRFYTYTSIKTTYYNKLNIESAHVRMKLSLSHTVRDFQKCQNYMFSQILFFFRKSYFSRKCFYVDNRLLF